MTSSHRHILLAGASLTVLLSAAWSSFAADAPAQLPDVVVVDSAPAPAEGSAEAGYRASTATLGPLGTAPLKDTPYSINVVSSDLMQNLQATSASDALKYDPTVRPQLGSNYSSNYFMIRGFSSSPLGATSNATVDSMRETALFEPIEDKERVEVLDGPAGFLYGFAAPGGTVNYALKHPTDTRLNRVTVGDYGGEQGYAHGDFGGPIDQEGRFGYRVNLVKVDAGNVGVEGETHKRELFSGMLDWHLAPNSVWSAEASHFDRDIRGQQAIFMVGSATQVPAAPNLGKNYGAPWAFSDDQYDRYGSSIKATLSDAVTVRSALRYTETRNSVESLRGNLTGNSGGDTDSQVQVKGNNGYDSTQGYAFVDVKFSTLGLTHAAIFGIAQDHVVGLTAFPDPNNGVSDLVTLSPAIGASLASPNPPSPKLNINLSDQLRQTSRTDMRTLVVADKITLTERWSVLAGFNLPRMQTFTFGTNTGAMTAQYAAEKITPAGAVMFKPIPAVTTYVSYVEALQQGPVVGATYANSGQILAPYLSNQYEVGAKSTFGRMDVNVALFEIDKANTVIDPSSNIESLNGEEVHRGAEVTFAGKATDDLTVGGGVTLLNTIVTEATPSSGQSGTTPPGVPHAIATLFGEYAVPQLRGVTLLAGGSYTGKEWVQTTIPNTVSIPSVFTMDAGARYTAEIYGTPTTLRLNVDNLLDTRYWTSKGDNFLYPGNPRTFAFSMSADF